MIITIWESKMGRAWFQSLSLWSLSLL